MAGIKQPILDIITKLKTLTTLQTVRIWNNQLNHEKGGKLYDYAKPAVFLEVVNNVEYKQLGGGYQGADVAWRLHIIHEFYDAQDGTFEQDLPVFDIRDAIVTLLSFYEPTGCGPLTRTSETQDYEHDNLYHYIIDFVCNFIDSKGSKDDQGKYIDKTPPTDLELDVYAPNNLVATVYERTYSYEYTATQNQEQQVYMSPALNVDQIVSIRFYSIEFEPNEYSYDPGTGFINLSPSVYLTKGQTILIIYSKTS